jgi:hypothetical protein
MEFPTLDGNPLINDIIDKYWHNKYVKVADLAAHTKKLLNESRSDENELQASNSVRTPMEITIIFSWRMIMGRIFHGFLCAIRNWWTFAVQNTHRDVETAERADGESSNPVDENLPLGEDFISKKKLRQDLEQRGLLQLLSFGEPKQLGFRLAWYRHSLKP